MLLENPDMAPAEMSDFLSRAELTKSVLNQYVRSTPTSRRQFRLINQVFNRDESETAVIQIVPDSFEEPAREEKYLTKDNYKLMNETIKRHLNRGKYA
jgi:hypothetical protein